MSFGRHRPFVWARSPALAALVALAYLAGLSSGGGRRSQPVVTRVVDGDGRLLRYVYVGEIFVNAELVRLGYANAYTDPPDVEYADLFVNLEREARAANRGLWDPTVCAAP